MATGGARDQRRQANDGQHQGRAQKDAGHIEENQSKMRETDGAVPAIAHRTGWELVQFAAEGPCAPKSACREEPGHVARKIHQQPQERNPNGRIGLQDTSPGNHAQASY
jgi:hypothetical protein